MNVLVYTEHNKGKFKKAIFEAITYGKKVAKDTGGNCYALVLGTCDDMSTITNYGADKIIHVNNKALNRFDSQQHSHVVKEVTKDKNCDLIVFANSANVKSTAGRVSAALDAGLVSMVYDLPISYTPFTVKRKVFSGKAIANYSIVSDKKIVVIAANSTSPEIQEVESGIEVLSVEIPSSEIEIIGQDTVEGVVPLPEAELVVSAGRGMKGPENWGIIEDLADALGATTACSRPVADSDWRPHHEHVGQTGVAISPNLYIAIGISGAIQHLAGVNNSKVIVVVNKDPEAPFFKAADYGVEGDLFDVIPKLTEAIKRFKAAQS